MKSTAIISVIGSANCEVSYPSRFLNSALETIGGSRALPGHSASGFGRRHRFWLCSACMAFLREVRRVTAQLFSLNALLLHLKLWSFS